MFCRHSFVKFLLLTGFIWFILLVFMSQWTEENFKRELEADKLGKILIEKMRADEANEPVPIFDDFEDNFADPPEKTTKKPKTKKLKVTRQSEKAWQNFDPPSLSQEIVELHRRLNISNPGHMGEPVILPSNLPLDIQEKVNKSWEIYSINEFVSNLIPLDRELPDIRPDYCRTVEYSTNLPVTSVIMIFHNEPFTMIMRSVFAVFKRTPAELLGEIILVDDCSDRGE